MNPRTHSPTLNPPPSPPTPTHLELARGEENRRLCTTTHTTRTRKLGLCATLALLSVIVHNEVELKQNAGTIPLHVLEKARQGILVAEDIVQRHRVRGEERVAELAKESAVAKAREVRPL